MAINFTGDFSQVSNTLRVGVTGVGAGTVNGGSVLDLQPTFMSADDPYLVLGDEVGGDGTLTVTGMNSTIDMRTSSTSGDAVVDVGRVGSGELNVLAGASMSLGGGNLNTSTTFSIGREAGGFGSVNLDGDGNVGGIGMFGSANFFGIAREGGSGSMTLNNGASLNMIDPNSGFSQLSVGRNGGGTATLDVSQSSIGVSSDGGFAFFDIARDGTTGTVTIENDSSVFIDSGQEAFSNFGGNGGTATLNILSGSRLDINGGYDAGDIPNPDNYTGANFHWGRDEGTATINVDDSMLNVTASNGDAGGTLGRNRIGTSVTELSEATMNLTNGATFRIEARTSDSYLNVARDFMTKATLNVTDSSLQIIDSDDADAFLGIGRDGGDGQVNLDNADVEISSVNARATVVMGRSPVTAGGSATMILENGTDFKLTGDVAAFEVGLDDDTSSLLQVLSGSKISVTGTGPGATSGDYAGPYAGVMLIGEQENLIRAEVQVVGVGSEIDVSHGIQVGYNPADPNNNGLVGNGRLQVREGGTITSGDLYLGRGGVTVMGDATINLDPSAPESGTMFIEESDISFLATGPVTLTGNLFLGESTDFTFDVAADGSSAGKLIQNGSVLEVADTGSPSSLFVQAQGGYQFVQGDSYVLFESNATTADAILPFAGQVEAEGQSAGFGFALSEVTSPTISLTFTALNNGNGSGTAVLNFGAASTVAASFEYDTDAGTGDGSGGTLGTVQGYNLDAVSGTAANDTFAATGSGGLALSGMGGDDTLIGGAGGDAFDGGDGFDTVTYASSGAAVFVNLDNPGANTGDAAGDTFVGVERIIGTDFNDRFDGSVDDDVIFGGLGDDVLIGRGGRDELHGEDGDDRMVGGNNGDILVGGAGADEHFGGAGTNFASYVDADAGLRADLNNAATNTGFAAGDTYVDVGGLIGSDFDDRLVGDDLFNLVEGGDGLDTLSGGGRRDLLSGGAGQDRLFGNAGRDELNGGLGADELSGGAGSDTASYADAASGVKADLLGIASSSGEAVGDTYASIENLRGSAFSDTLRGDDAGNRIDGGDGVDALIGRGGRDTLRGEGGRDFLDGGADNDVLVGGAGDDRFIFRDALSIDRIADFEVGIDRIQLDDAGFASLTTGTLSADNFVAGLNARDADDFILYQASTGRLFYDADGDGAGASVRIGTLTNNAALDHDDFQVI